MGLLIFMAAISIGVVAIGLFFVHLDDKESKKQLQAKREKSNHNNAIELYCAYCGAKKLC